MADPREAAVHQAGDIALEGIAVGGGIIASGIAIAVVVPWLVIARLGTPASAPNDASRPAIERGPVQETAPREDIAAFRRGKMRRLESDGIDPATGRPHISIERAMEILAARGANPAPDPAASR
jgi:hypothetical protein